jgi:hypothetical protein
MYSGRAEDLFALTTHLFHKETALEGILDDISDKVISSDKFSLGQFRKFFEASIFLVQGNPEGAFHHLQEIFSSDEVIRTIAHHGAPIDREIVEGVFAVINGVIEKDTQKLVKGILQIKKLFNLPPKIDAMLSLMTALITRSTIDIELLIQQFCGVFDYDSAFLVGLVQLAKRDYAKFAEFATRFGQCDVETIQKFISLLSHLGLLTSKPTGGLRVMSGKSEGKDAASGMGNLSYQELFVVRSCIRHLSASGRCLTHSLHPLCSSCHLVRRCLIKIRVDELILKNS